jgi:plasmid stabilization system protein ParE
VRIELSGFIESDLEAIANFIAQDNPTRAVTFIQEIRAKTRLVAKQPLTFQLRPEIGEGARITIVGRHVILFRVIGQIVRIERVVFGGRDLPALLE